MHACMLCFKALSLSFLELLSKFNAFLCCVPQMLHDRGYLVTEGELHATKDDFRDRFGDDPRRDDLTLLKHKRDNPSEEVGVPCTSGQHR